jgi:hypothetical protein
MLKSVSRSKKGLLRGFPEVVELKRSTYLAEGEQPNVTRK